MQIAALRVFCAVYEHKSFANAARKCGISPSMVTRYIQHIEMELETTLFIRTTRSISTTEAGKLFYHQCKEMIAQYDAGIKAIRTLEETVAGTIKIGLPASISQVWVTPALQKLSAHYPELTFQLCAR